MVERAVDGSVAANDETTSLGRRERGVRDGDGGERSERAASTGADVESEVGVSQNM